MIQTTNLHKNHTVHFFTHGQTHGKPPSALGNTVHFSQCPGHVFTAWPNSWETSSSLGNTVHFFTVPWTCFHCMAKLMGNHPVPWEIQYIFSQCPGHAFTGQTHGKPCSALGNTKIIHVQCTCSSKHTVPLVEHGASMQPLADRSRKYNTYIVKVNRRPLLL